MKITVELKIVYGCHKYYPICDMAKSFAQIAKTQTLTFDTIKTIKGMGFEIEVKTPQVSF
jgi:hypothetical protein